MNDDKNISYEENFPTLNTSHKSPKKKKQKNPQAKEIKTEISSENAVIKCKDCSEIFTDLTKSLAHELTHVIDTSHKGNDKTANHRVGKRSKKKIIQLSKESNNDTEFKKYVISTLSNCPEDTVLQTFSYLFQPSQIHLNVCFNKIYEDLKTVMMKIGTWRIYPFGSTITGMSLKTSDMDFYVERINNSVSSKLTEKGAFYQIKDVLYFSNMFSNVIAVPRARVPVIKCQHNITGYNLDINLTSRIGVHNSEFIHKVINFDRRIHPLLLIIKVWAKSWELTNTGRITNYCLTVLVFFYLQTCEPPILPPIKQFQLNYPDRLIDGYNFTFGFPMNFNRNANTDNILDLLKGFFKFYANYDFKNLIICIYLGISISKNELAEGKFKFPEYEKQVEHLNMQALEKNNSKDNIRKKSVGLNCNHSVIIQDPFCLTMNKFNTGPHIFTYFSSRLQIAHELFTTTTTNNMLGLLITKLLYENPDHNKNLNQTKGDNNKEKNYNYADSKVCNLSPLESELTFIRCYFRKNDQEKSIQVDEIKKIWCEKIIAYLIEFLEGCYKIEVIRVYNDEISKKSPKSIGQNDIHSNDDTIQMYTIRTNLDLWNDRKCANTKTGYTNHLEKTLEITKLKENDRKLNQHYQVDLVCELKFLTAKDYSSVTMYMTNKNGKIGVRPFKTLFHEFSTKSRNSIIGFFERFSKEKWNDDAEFSKKE